MLEIKIVFPTIPCERSRFEQQLERAGVDPRDVKRGKISEVTAKPALLRELIWRAAEAGEPEALEPVDFSGVQPQRFLADSDIESAIDEHAVFRATIKAAPVIFRSRLRDWYTPSTGDVSDAAFRRYTASLEQTLAEFPKQPVKFELGTFYNPGYADAIVRRLRSMAAQLETCSRDGAKLSVDYEQRGGESCEWWNPFQHTSYCAKTGTVTMTLTKTF